MSVLSVVNLGLQRCHGNALDASVRLGLATSRSQPYVAPKFDDTDPRTTLDLLDLVTEVIDLRSFSNLWYWIVLAILWSTLSHWTVGVPYHIVTRARRGDAKSHSDMETLARMQSDRLLNFSEMSGAISVGLSFFLLTGLAVLGWLYRLEFCQAVFLLLCPALMVLGLSVWTAKRLRDDDFQDIPKFLRQHRTMVQFLGVIFIFLTAFWGMYQNWNVGPLG